jgi:glycosyltransferase involved in cell wall biosynthesis
MELKKSVKILHHTEHVPYHTRLRGTEIHILNHAYGTKYEAGIVTRRTDLPEEDRRFICDVVGSAKGTKIHFMPYDLDVKIHEYEQALAGAGSHGIVEVGGSRRNVKQAMNELAAMKRRRHTKTGSASEGESYIRFIEDELHRHDKLVLAFHEMDVNDLNTIKRVKDLFGKRVEVVGHLHCLSEYYTITDPRKKDATDFFQNLLENSYFDKIIAVSDEVERDFTSRFPRMKGLVQTVEAGVDGELYSPEMKKYKEELKKEIFGGRPVGYVVSYVGRLADAKGKTILLNLLKQYDVSNPDGIGFVFAAPPEDPWTRRFMDDVKRYAPGLLKQGNVQFCYDISKFTKGLGPEAVSSMKDRMSVKTGGHFKILTRPVQAATDIYMHPSSSESLGQSVVEALKTGVPVIASEIKGIREYATDEDGYFIKLGKDYIDWTLFYVGQKDGTGP